MQTFILQSENSEDLALLLHLAERLSIRYYETDNQVFDAEIPDTSALYEGLELKKEANILNFNDFSKYFDKSSFKDYEATSLFTTLEEVGGSWEDDKEETLEELLNLLN